MTLRPDAPFPLESPRGKWFVERYLALKAKKYGFSVTVEEGLAIYPNEAEHGCTQLMRALVLRDIPEVPDARMPLVDKIAKQMNAIANAPYGEIQESFEDGKIELPSEFESSLHGLPLNCMTCPHWSKVSGYAGRCLPASRFGRGRKGIREYVFAARHHMKFPETEFMEDGTAAHDQLELMRQPLRDVDQVLESLIAGKRTPFILHTCNRSYGIRATPDLIIGYLRKVTGGYELILHYIEDKPYADSDKMVQLGAEVEIARAEHGELLVLPPHLNYQEQIRTERTAFVEELGNRLNLQGDEEISVVIYYSMNQYGKDPTNPVDNYWWILKAEQPPGMKYPPRLYSVNGQRFRFPDEEPERKKAEELGKKYVYRNDILYFRVHLMKKMLRKAYKRKILETEETLSMGDTTVIGAVRRAKRATHPPLEHVLRDNAA